MKKVKAEISLNGRVSLEFTGFIGEECTEERERIRKVLLDFGVTLETEKIRKKSSQEIATELATTEKEKVKVNYS